MLTIKVNLAPDTKLPDPVGANFFHVVRMDNEIHLLVGNVSFLPALEAEAKGEAVPSLVPSVTHRFLLSDLGYKHLKSQLELMEKGFRAKQAE